MAAKPIDKKTWQEVLQELSDEFHEIMPAEVDVKEFAKRAKSSGAPADALAAFGSGLATYSMRSRSAR